MHAAGEEQATATENVAKYGHVVSRHACERQTDKHTYHNILLYNILFKLHMYMFKHCTNK